MTEKSEITPFVTLSYSDLIREGGEQLVFTIIDIKPNTKNEYRNFLKNQGIAVP